MHFPLSSAYLCAELACSAVSDDPQKCPACGNTHVVSLSRIMDRKPVEKEIYAYPSDHIISAC